MRTVCASLGICGCTTYVCQHTRNTHLTTFATSKRCAAGLGDWFLLTVSHSRPSGGGGVHPLSDVLLVVLLLWLLLSPQERGELRLVTRRRRRRPPFVSFGVGWQPRLTTRGGITEKNKNRATTQNSTQCTPYAMHNTIPREKTGPLSTTHRDRINQQNVRCLLLTGDDDYGRQSE